jgi:hypothetical protein
MTTAEFEQTPEDQGGTTPTQSDPPPVPLMARRTYMCLRLGAVGVIAVLAASIIREYSAAGDCLQGSISAYFYTPVQSVFVGALLALGLVMIVLWGKTSFEDGAMNLAGLVAPVVAFVPTTKTNLCGLTTATGGDVRTQGEKASVIEASQGAIDNNMLAYIVIVGAVLALLAGVGILAHAKTHWAFVTEHPRTYWGPWVVAAVLWVLGTYAFAQHREWFYGNAHKWSAFTLFVFIVLVVFNIGRQKWKGIPELGEPADPRWAPWYWGIGALMSIGAVGIYLLAKGISHDFSAHRTFILEAWMIFWLAVFWLLQTYDRRQDGAPPRTVEEQQRVQDTTPQAAESEPPIAGAAGSS